MADTGADQAVLAAAWDRAVTLVRPGFLPRQEAALVLAEWANDEGLDYATADAVARRVVDEVWEDHLRAQAHWSLPTDADRLRAAFDELTALGVVCRMDYLCCTNCGNDSIREERRPLEPGEEPPFPGYPYRDWASVFFHDQDAERLAEEPATLTLTYGCWRPGPSLPEAIRRRWKKDDDACWAEADTALGHLICAVLDREGLQTTWAETSTDKIRVVDLRWRRRLGRSAALDTAYGPFPGEA